MKHKVPTSGEQLEDAFQLFNQLSEKLSDSYGDLEKQVAHLSEELLEARSERLQQLAEKEIIARRLEGLLDTLPAGIIVMDADGNINQVNPVAQEMFGQDLLGLSWLSIAKKITITDDDELHLENGRWISVSACPLDAEQGKIILITDITETRSLQNTVSRQQRLSSLGEMAASLAHQIRTPLASAILYLSNMSHPDAHNSDRLRFTEKAKEQLGHLERMVDDMQVFVRGGVLESECFCVGEIVDQLRLLLEPKFLESKATLIIDNQIPEAPLRGNRDALLGAFQNLANNAIESCGDTPIMEIKINWSRDEAVVFSFRDNGSGIANDIKERILEPFYTTKASGTGLGLSVVNATVISHHGELDIQSEQGVGSCFSIKLPMPELYNLIPDGPSLAEKEACPLSEHANSNNYNLNYFHSNKEVKV